MTIKHLVISGGGQNGIKSLGILKELCDKSFWNIKDIQTIYATSAGSILSLLLILENDIDTISTYILNRPWHEAYSLDISQIFDIYKNKGLYSNITEIFFKPFLDSKDLPLTITMQELFEYSGIELHVFSLEINDFKICDISHKTHPDLFALTAIHMSIAIPIVFAPVCLENKCYIDGGMISNYPLQYCLDQCPKPDINEILGLRRMLLYENSNIQNDSNILEFLMKVINKLLDQVDTELKQITIPNEVTFSGYNVNLQILSETLYSFDIRKELFDDGIHIAKQFLKNKNKNKEEEEDEDEEDKEDEI
jgi:predicted acylesterase/phospholipase RssA